MRMPTPAETIATYMAVWNEPDATKRKPLLEKCWADDGLYCDPVSDGRGRDALDGFIASMHAQQPGARIDATSAIDQHHNQVRFAWAFIGADGKTAIEGIDAGELAPDGRLARIIGFWGAPPPKA
jgi:hypothetical protein